MPRKLDDSRRFPVADAAEARALTLALAEAFLAAIKRRPDVNRGSLHGSVEDGGLSVSTEPLAPIKPSAIRSLFEDADADKLDPDRIYLAFYPNFTPEITINWMKKFGGRVTVSVATSEVGWGRDMLDLAERVARSKPAPGSVPAIFAPPAAPSPAAPSPVAPGSSALSSPPRSGLGKGTWGFILTVVGAVIAGGILKAFGWV